MNGLFLSDLHLFSRRSTGQERWDASASRIREADLIVLGGDLFDLRWSQVGNLADTLDAAKDWLLKAVALNPDAKWVFLPGNHDCHPEMLYRLTQISDQHENFEWHSEHWRIGDHVFLHGDVLDGRRHKHGLMGYRKAFHEDRAKGELANMLYSAVIFSRLHGVVPRIRHSRNQTCATLLNYVEQEYAIPKRDIQAIYFGHTHVPFSGYVYRGVSFHNPGSGIRHLRYSPVPFQVPDA